MEKFKNTQTAQLVGLKHVSELFTMTATQNKHFNDLSDYSVYGNMPKSPNEKERNTYLKPIHQNALTVSQSKEFSDDDQIPEPSARSGGKSVYNGGRIYF